MKRIWDQFSVMRLRRLSNGRDETTSEEMRERQTISVSYDTSLPAQHTYMGTDLEELTGRTVLDDDSYQSMPLLTSHEVILVPGQTLPLQLYRPMEIAMMRRIIENDRTFGIISDRFAGELSSGSRRVLGTTAEVRSYKEETDNRSGTTVLFVKAEGRQRFHVMDTRTRADGILMANVKILPERSIQDPGTAVKLQSLDRHRTLSPAGTSGLPLGSNMSSIGPRQFQRKYTRHDFSYLTWWPPWVYKMYDADLLVEKIGKELSGWNSSLSTVSSRDPVEFSYWVAANLPLDDSLRLELLSYNSAVQRLRCELSILNKYTVLCCRDCNAQIADRHDIFSMSQQGPQGTYVNPHGHVHETVTVYKARGLYLNGRPSTQYSWFPGYAWTVLQCRGCHNHMGWKFTAQDKKLHPDKFWGLCRSSIYPGLNTEENEEQGFIPCI